MLLLRKKYIPQAKSEIKISLPNRNNFMERFLNHETWIKNIYNCIFPQIIL